MSDESLVISELRADVVHMRRIAFGIETALEKTPRGMSMEREIALFVKRMLFDYADALDLNADD